MSALVSVLIPAFNAQRWIGSAIECALDQSWPHKEVIVVDDASTDDTLAVARSFAGRGVQVISQARRGAAAARNTALRSAQGSYVQYLDADDLIHPDKLSLQLRGVEAGHRSRTLLTSAWGRFFDRVDHARFVPDFCGQDLAPVDWLVRKFADNKFMFPATWLVSSTVDRVRRAMERGPVVRRRWRVHVPPRRCERPRPVCTIGEVLLPDRQFDLAELATIRSRARIRPQVVVPLHRAPPEAREQRQDAPRIRSPPAGQPLAFLIPKGAIWSNA